MDEQERLENEAEKLRNEIKQLQISLRLGEIEDNTIIKEKRDKLFNVLFSLKLCKMNNKEDNNKRR